MDSQISISIKNNLKVLFSVMEFVWIQSAFSGFIDIRANVSGYLLYKEKTCS